MKTESLTQPVPGPLKAAQTLHDLFQPGMGTNFVQELVPKVAEIIDRETGYSTMAETLKATLKELERYFRQSSEHPDIAQITRGVINQAQAALGSRSTMSLNLLSVLRELTEATEADSGLPSEATSKHLQAALKDAHELLADNDTTRERLRTTGRL